jgi:hypothetical protein
MSTNPTVPNIVNTVATGGVSTSIFIDVFESRNPTTTDVNYPVQKKWFNTTSGEYWILQNFSSLGGVVTANWVNLTQGDAGEVSTLTGNDDIAVSAVSGNINVQGTSSGAIEFTSGGAGQLNAAVQVDGVTITVNASNQLEAIDGGLIWIDVTGTTQTMVANHGYTADNASLITFTLPAMAAYGSLMAVQGKGAGGWTIVENTGQTIHWGNISTTTSTGSLSSVARYDTVYLLCIVANTDFAVQQPTDILTYV